MNFSLIRRAFATKKVRYGNQARKILLEGSNLLTKTVDRTLGPGGRNVCIEYEVGLPRITKDGVTVAKNILSTDNEVYLFYIN